MRLVATFQVMAGIAPTFFDQRGCVTVTRAGPGTYDVRLDTNFAENEVNANATIVGDSVGFINAKTYVLSGQTFIRVNTVDMTNTPTDMDFMVNAVGLR
ncbi:MAG: hypothetical protein E6Q97_20515 [Desulfurellales bacterium]|nr:MAG: hypothetical protein E6Q97_20515 [Desulfurellales bacterium]